MGLLSMDAATANSLRRFRIGEMLRWVKWCLPAVTQGEDGVYRDLDLGPGVCTIPGIAITVYLEYADECSGLQLEPAIDEYIRRVGLKPFTEPVIEEF